MPSEGAAGTRGAHLYGFPSRDSDVDLRGCHLLPLEEVIGLRRSPETVERDLDHRGQEVELVSHDLGKYLRLLAKNNGYVLEQVFSPLVVMGQEFLDRLRPVARLCITRNLRRHYEGFLRNQLGLLDREEPKRAKTLLYVYRVLLTGIHVLRTGRVEWPAGPGRDLRPGVHRRPHPPEGGRGDLADRVRGA